MAQKTLVLQIPRDRGQEIQRRFASAGFEFRPAPYAWYSARGAGVVATHYTSGKFVIQGEDPEAFALAFVDGERVSDAPKKAASAPAKAETTVGSDETGKGDYFGPLVVAAVRLDPALARALEGGEVRDCKLMSDESVLRVGAALRAKVPHAIARLDPPRYNETHARFRNLNPLLASLHAEAIGKLTSPGMHVIVDQFGRASLLEEALASLDVRLEQRHRAEELLVVAAASVIAREQFLTALQDLSEAWAVDLAKGAGDPVDRAARRFVALHGREKLGEVAKLHFKNTQKLARAGGR